MKLRKKIVNIFKRKDKSGRQIASELNIPKSTVYYNLQQSKKREAKSGTTFWDTDEGYTFMIRLVIASIYSFALKGGFGAGKLKSYFEMLNIGAYLAISESTVLKIIKEIEKLILQYNASKTHAIKSNVKEIELILGVDETWFDKMLLVCQELQSGFIFCEETANDRSAQTWDRLIKKTFSLSQ
jgi:predicted DNA-binding protein YlxM (UPF0122 family)